MKPPRGVEVHGNAPPVAGYRSSPAEPLVFTLPRRRVSARKKIETIFLGLILIPTLLGCSLLPLFVAKLLGEADYAMAAFFALLSVSSAIGLAVVIWLLVREKMSKRQLTIASGLMIFEASASSYSVPLASVDTLTLKHQSPWVDLKARVQSGALTKSNSVDTTLVAGLSAEHADYLKSELDPIIKRARGAVVTSRVENKADLTTFMAGSPQEMPWAKKRTLALLFVLLVLPIVAGAVFSPRTTSVAYYALHLTFAFIGFWALKDGFAPQLEVRFPLTVKQGEPIVLRCRTDKVGHPHWVVAAENIRGQRRTLSRTGRYELARYRYETTKAPFQSTKNGTNPFDNRDEPRKDQSNTREDE